MNKAKPQLEKDIERYFQIEVIVLADYFPVTPVICQLLIIVFIYKYISRLLIHLNASFFYVHFVKNQPACRTAFEQCERFINILIRFVSLHTELW